MKTISELSGTVIRMAAAAIAEARRSLPVEEPPASPPRAASEPESVPAEAGTESAPGGAATESVAADAAETTPAEAGAAEAAPADGGLEAAPAAAEAAPSGKPAPRGESEAVKAALDEAAAKATGFSGDRLAMVRAAVEVAGSRLKDVRLVRVFGTEEKLNGGRIVGDYQYVVDFHPTAMKQVAGSHKEERGGRGGGRGRGGGGGGGGGGAGGAGRGAKGSTTGGFSMDSLRDDRKKEGGGRGRPGGGPRKPGGPGRPPGGPPKK